jgi:hypothetical protein
MSQGVFVNAVLRGLGYKVAKVIFATAEFFFLIFIVVCVLSLTGWLIHQSQQPRHIVHPVAAPGQRVPGSARTSHAGIQE